MVNSRHCNARDCTNRNQDNTSAPIVSIIKPLLNAGVKKTSVISGLLVLRQQIRNSANQNEKDRFSMHDAMHSLAKFLVNSGVSKKAKLACLEFLHYKSHEALIFCSQTKETASNFEDTISLLMHSKNYDSLGISSTSQTVRDRIILLWQLRAVCFYQIKIQTEHILTTVETLSCGISTVARSIHNGLVRSAKIIRTNLRGSSQWIVARNQHHDQIIPISKLDSQYNLASQSFSRDDIVIVTYTSTARRASSYVCHMTTSAIQKIRETTVTSQYPHLYDGEYCSTTPEQNTTIMTHHIQTLPVTLQVMGTIVLVAIGVVAIVGDGVLLGTSTIVQGLTDATSDLVGHWYGPTAGCAVHDIGITIHNLMRIARNANLLLGHAPTALISVLAKNNGRMHLEGLHQKHSHSKQ